MDEGESMSIGRIVGMSLGEEHYQGVRKACDEYEMTEAEVVRHCVSMGLEMFLARYVHLDGDLGMYEMIEQLAAELGLPAHVVARGAIQEGLQKGLERFVQRSRQARDEETLRQMRGALGLDEQDRPV